jgi:phage FluMu gp28-like protein
VCEGDGSARDAFRHFSRYRVDVHTAARLGFPNPEWSDERRAAHVEQLRAEAGDPETFARESECSWVSADSMFLGPELLAKARYDDDELPPSGPMFLGVDVGRKKHLTAISRVVRGEDGRLYALPFRRNVDTLRNVPFEEQQDAVGRLIADGARRVCIDSTGLGSAPSEALARRFSGRVEPVVFTNQVKEELATSLRLGLEEGKLRLPGDIELLRDLGSLRRTLTAAGNVRFDASDSGGSHADRAWALALAVHAAGTAIHIPENIVRPTGRSEAHELADAWGGARGGGPGIWG